MKPIKFLKGTLGTLIQSGTTTVNGTTGVANAWTANLTAINPQAHNDSTTPRPMTYNGLDINVGDWIVSTGEGKCLKITAISAQTSTTASITLTDDQNYNYLTDQDLGGIIATGGCYIFEVINNNPVLGNIPANLPGAMSGTSFAESIENRFQTQYTHLVLPGDPTQALQAVPKQYVDTTLSTHAANLTLHLSGGQNTLLDNLSASAAELNHSVGVTSDIQGQIDSKLASVSYTAADVLTKIKTVDGIGSGLDADTLDGLEATAFTPIAHATDQTLHLTSSQNTLVDGITATAAELNYSVGVTSSIQSQLGGKQASLGFTAENVANKNAAGGYAGLIAGLIAATHIPALDWSKIATGKPTTVAGYGITDALQTFSFSIQYTVSNPTSVIGLPSGWTATFNYGGNPTSVLITHNLGKPLGMVIYWGADSSVTGQTLRLPNSTYKAVIPTANPNTQFLIDIPGSATSTDPGGICRIFVLF